MLIDAMVFFQFCRAALFGCHAVFEDYDLVCFCDCPHTVCNDHYSLIPDQAGEGFLDEGFVVYVQGRRCFVEENDRCIFQKCAGYGDSQSASLLAHNQITAPQFIRRSLHAS